MLTLCMLFVLLFSLCSFGREYRLFVVCGDDGPKWIRRWKPIWIPSGGSFQKAEVDEWEEEVYAFENSDQGPEYHCRDPCPRYHQPHDSCDGSESHCGSYWASQHADPDCLHVPKDDGWSASRELPPVPPGLSSTRQSPWQPCPDTSAPMKRWVFKRLSSASPQSRKRAHQWSLSHWTRLHHRHPVFAMPFIQSSLASPNQLLLPHPDDEMPSDSEEDVSSIRDGCTVWVKVDPASILERPLG